MDKKRNKLVVGRAGLWSLVLACLLMACQNSTDGNRSGSSGQPGETDAAALTEPVKDFIYDIPDGFVQCHASTIARTDNGEFVVTWFGGTEEKNDDVGIWMSRGKPGDWSKPVELEKLRDD